MLTGQSYYSRCSINLKIQAMPTTSSDDLPRGAPAPTFTLPDPRTGQAVSLADFEGYPLVVVFMCNHCPYVVHILDALVRLAADSATKGVGTVAINANDVNAYPADSTHHMAVLAEQKQFGFPYLFDETQKVARAYSAVCTPDIFLFDAHHRLFHRGRFDATRPHQGATADGRGLQAAIDALLAGEPAPTPAHPSVGCSIKWAPGASPT